MGKSSAERYAEERGAEEGAEEGAYRVRRAWRTAAYRDIGLGRSVGERLVSLAPTSNSFDTFRRGIQRESNENVRERTQYGTIIHARNLS